MRPWAAPAAATGIGEPPSRQMRGCSCPVPPRNSEALSIQRKSAAFPIAEAGLLGPKTWIPSDIATASCTPSGDRAAAGAVAGREVPYVLSQRSKLTSELIGAKYSAP